MLIILGIMIGLLLNPAIGDFKTYNATRLMIATDLGNAVAYEFAWNDSPCHYIPSTGIACDFREIDGGDIK